MSPRRASLPPPLPPLATLAAPPRSRWGQNYQNKTASATRNPFPTPSPARARPFTSLRFRSGRAAGLLAAPSRSRRGHKYNKKTIKTFNTCATHVPCPTPPPARACPGTSLRWRSGRARSDARRPPPLPVGAYNDIIHTFQHNYCVSALPHPANDFFFLCSVIHLVPCLATLRHGPRRAPSQRFSGCAHHKSNS